MTLEQELRGLAREQGFAVVRFADAVLAESDREAARERVRRGDFDGLPWFDEARVERAADPARVVPGARSLVLLAAGYRHDVPRPADDRLRGRISRYAWGRDYHRVLERRGRPLLGRIGERRPGARSRLLVDHGPLLERAFARRAGVGWQGKNAMILSRGAGSWTFLAAIVTTAELEPDEPVPQGCGTCTRCLPSCPTGALRGPWEVVNDLCISHHTIENRGAIPRELREHVGDWVFGCDLCQEACPVNDDRVPAGLPELAPADAGAAWPDLLELLALDEEGFRTRFAGRPILRAKHAGFLRNVCVALGNLGDRRAVPALERTLAGTADPRVRGHAAWALGRLGARTALERRRDGERDPFVREEIEAALAGAEAA